MAGTVPGLSGQQQFDSQGRPLSGGLLYFYATGTLNPQNAYQDSGLTILHPNPITLPADGRVPLFYVADGSIKFRLTTSAGVTVWDGDQVLVIGPSTGSGSPASVDATTVLATGDIKVKYGTGALTGFVRANGRTIGSATSGATERAHADTQSLFEFLWTADANLTVSGGRGASANADWSANKTIALPDWRGRVIAGLDDMGNSAAGRLSSTYFGTSAIVLGAAGGSESNTLTSAKMPSHTHTASVTDTGHTHGLAANSISVTGPATTIHILDGAGGSSIADKTSTSSTTGISVSNANTGSGEAHANVQPTLLATIYIKL